MGCTVATTIEAFENGVNSILYSNECKDTISNVITYMKGLYSDCALPSCHVKPFTALCKDSSDIFSGFIFKVVRDVPLV